MISLIEKPQVLKNPLEDKMTEMVDSQEKK
jgi:hypothetical protein